MVGLRRLVFLLVCVGVAACSTRVSVLTPVAGKAGKAFTIREITSEVGVGASKPSETFLTRLENAVKGELAQRPQGGQDVRLHMILTKAEVVPRMNRIFLSGLAGSDVLYVNVTAYDLASGKTLGEFDVKREANSLGYGAFYDTEESLLQNVAEEIAATL